MKNPTLPNMKRNKRKHAAIPNESLRNTTLQRTRDSLFKKAKELSTLCDVEVGVIIQDKEKTDEFVWPSHHEVEEMLMRFLSIPENKRNQKMSTLEGFLAGIVNKKVEHIRKIHETNDEKESKYLMHELIKGKITIKELDMKQTHRLTALMLDQMNKFEERIQELDNTERQGNQSLPTPNPHPHSIIQMLTPSEAQDSGVHVSIPARELIEDSKNDQKLNGCGSNAIDLDKNLIHDKNNGEWFIDNHINASFSDPKFIEELKNDKWSTETMFDKQNISYPSRTSEMGHHHDNEGSSEGNNVGKYKTTASTNRENHMDLTPTNEVADHFVGLHDGFPDVEWSHIFLP